MTTQESTEGQSVPCNTQNPPSQEFCGKCGGRVSPGKAIVIYFGAGGRVHEDPAECSKPRRTLSPSQIAALARGRENSNQPGSTNALE